MWMFENLGAAEVSLSDADIAAIEARLESKKVLVLHQAVE